MGLVAFASIAPGLEPMLVEELEELGIRAAAQPGGASFETDLEGLAKIHRWSRVAGRVTVELGATKASSLDELARGLRGMRFRDYVHPGQPIAVKVTTKLSRLHFPDTVAKKVEHVVHDALRGPRRLGPKAPREPATVLVRIERDRAHVSVDASGDRMHRRGWRLATAKAPLRENLAAAVLRAMEWRGDRPFVDPMCGSGTFPIEAALMALGHPPGAHRDFAFLNWPVVHRGTFESSGKPPTKRSSTPPILGADRDEGAIAATLANARRAKVDRVIRVQRCEFAALEPPDTAGLLVANPPYGERIDRGRIHDVWRSFGRVLSERWTGYTVGLLCPDPALIRGFGFRLEPVCTFKNGGISVTLFGAEVR